jgi:hypothetical protein
VIGYKRGTSDVVVGDKCWTVMLKCERHKFFCDKKCSFIRTKYLNNRWNRFSYDFMKNMISMHAMVNRYKRRSNDMLVGHRLVAGSYTSSNCDH